MQGNEKQNRMGTMSMGRLVLSMGVPLMISMLVQALYNVVDSLYVSHIVDAALPNAGDLAVQALTLSFPIQMLMIAFNTGTGVGINAVLSRFLGQGDREKASYVAGNALFLGGCMYVVFLLFGLFGAEAYFRTLTSDPVTLQMGVDYLRVCTIGSFSLMGFFTFEKTLQATGKSMMAMICQLSGAVTNIILDPFFIFGWLGLPAMGVKGAAVATVLGQCVSLAVGAYLHYGRNNAVDKGLRYLKPNGRIIGQVYRIGAPAIVMQSLTSVMSYGVNMLLGTASALLVTAYGVYSRLQNFIFMPCFGLNNAIVPITGFSYGARRRDRIMQALRWGLTDAAVIMGTGILLIQCLAPQIVGIFAVSDQVQKLAVRALRIICLGYLLTGCNVIFQGFFQALGNGVYSLILSMLRMVAVPLPLVWLLISARQVDWVWLAFPAGELAAFLAALVMLRVIHRRRIAPLPSVSGS